MRTHELLEAPGRAPDTADFLEFGHRGVRVRAYGVLHGITGGTNAEYVRFVERTVAAAPGTVLAEMGMRRMYRGVRLELDDWLQIPFRDAAALGALLTCHPTAARSVAGGLLGERTLRRRDRFMRCGHARLQDLGGSPAFHRLDPWERRRLVGFPEPRRYLETNLARRRGGPAADAPRFPDPDWAWLSVVEPRANIACRSVHMLEYAAEFARRTGAAAVSLVVGEIHNTDMHWLAHGGTAELGDGDRRAAERIAERARRHAADRAAGRRTPLRRLPFSLGVALGGLPLSAVAGVGAACLLA